MGTTGMMLPMSSMPMEEAIKKSFENPEVQAQRASHLRSVKEVNNYTIHALDNPIGNVNDFIVDDNDWKIDYIVVDTGNWFPGKKVILSRDSIKEIKWETSEVIVNVSVEQIKNSPEYDPSKQLNKAYESSLKNYYANCVPHK